ncbi:MAG: secondary thiamine-phosphate synthase enzyme YjbQ [Candidatus Woesearchaeota archaeon]
MEFTIKTSKKEECVDISHELEEIIKNSNVVEGILHIFVPHATATIIINENADPNIPDDFLKALDKLIPQGVWKHDRIDNNGAAHIKAAILGPSETIPIKNNQLQLGTWQSPMLVELDGPKQRRIILKIIKDQP